MNETIEVLNKLLDASALRQRVLANNLANINTPGFKRLDVKFQDELADAIRSHSAQKIADVNPVVEKDRHSAARPDGNTVNLQTEMAEMTENGILYQMCTKAITAKFSRLRSVIKGQ